MNNPKLFFICLPIGNFSDLSLRAIELIQKSDLLIGEEFKSTVRLLKKIGLENPKFELLNEHTKSEEVLELTKKIYQSKLTCLFSDGGSPTFEDPGRKILSSLDKSKVKIEIVPGPTALSTALSICNFPSTPFTFFGFLERDKKKRKIQITQYLKTTHTLAFYETPYRYKQVILDLKNSIGKRKIFLGLNLTQKDEFIFEGNISHLIPKLENLPKANPTILIAPL